MQRRGVGESAPRSRRKRGARDGAAALWRHAAPAMAARAGRTRRGALARARARAGRAGPSCARAGAGRGAAAAPARPRRATAIDDAPCARGAARGAAQRVGAGSGGGEKAPGCAVANSGRRQMQEFLVSTTRCDVAWGSASSNSILGSEPVRRRRRVLGGGEDRCGGLGQGPPGMGHSPRAPAGGAKVNELEPSRATPPRRRGDRPTGLSRRAERRSLNPG